LITDTEAQQTLARLRRVAEASGGDPQIWTRYVGALVQAGQKGRARKAAKAAPLKGAARAALISLSEGKDVPAGAPLRELVALVGNGRLDEARQLGRALLRSYPDDAKLLNVMGVMALADEDAIDAEGYLRRALASDPNSVDVRSNLGLALVRQGRGTIAVGVLEPLATGTGAPLAARVNLASAYLAAERAPDVVTLTDSILADTPGDPETTALRTQALIKLGLGGEALECITPMAEREGFDLHDLVADALERSEGRERAIEYLAGLEHLPRATSRRLAALLAEWGELGRAEAIARTLASEDAGDPSPFRLVGLCGKWTAADPLIGDMEKGAANNALGPARRGSFALALAKARMDIGENDAGFAALVSGNAQLRTTVEYDVENDLAAFRKIVADWSAAEVHSLGSVAVPDIAPVFIVGLPRSGSTLIETILSRHPDVTPLGESPLVHAAVSAAGNVPETAANMAIREAAVSVLTPAMPGGVTTDKQLGNFCHLGALAAAFPNARFIECRRDLRAVCLSIFQAELAPAAHPYSMQLDELARYAVGYVRLMEHWSSVLGDRLYRASYEALVSDPSGYIPELTKAAGLSWHPSCLGTDAPERRISTMSVAQARKPINTASLARWRKFESGLAPLIAILEKEGLNPEPGLDL
jgi:tetratricopeptide (TPR) repeat protein